MNALSYLVVIAALLMMRIDDRRWPAPGPSIGRPPRRRSDFSIAAALEGLRFVFRVAAHPFDDAAGLFRDVLFVRDGAAADLRAGRAARRRARVRLALLGAGGRRGVASAVMVRAVDLIERRGMVSSRAIAIYGLATVAFGLSTWFWLTFWCLAATGAADTVSAVFRNLIRQLETPDGLRGRMTGVNMVFFMGGPQLGELEAGSSRMGGSGRLGRERRHRMSDRDGVGRGGTPGLRAYRRTGATARARRETIGAKRRRGQL